MSVLYRQDSDIVYHAVIPGYSGPNADVTGACTLDPDPANCPDPKQNEDAQGTPSYLLSGTTLSLGLAGWTHRAGQLRESPLGEWKLYQSAQLRNATDRATPTWNFSGQSAKLSWTMGQSDKKIESEIYRVVAMLAKPGQNNQIASNRGPAHTNI